MIDREAWLAGVKRGVFGSSLSSAVTRLLGREGERGEGEGKSGGCGGVRGEGGGGEMKGEG